MPYDWTDLMIAPATGDLVQTHPMATFVTHSSQGRAREIRRI